MRRLLITLIVLGACSTSSSRVGTQPSWRGAGARMTGPVTFAPTSEPAIRYNEPLQLAPRTPLRDALASAVTDAAGRAGVSAPIADVRMFRACAELAEIVPEEGIISYSLIEFALQRNGIIEPSPHLLVVWGSVDSPDVIVEQVQPRLAEILGDGATARFGIGTARRNADGTGAVVFALQGSGVSTLPIPRVTPGGSTVVIDAVIDPRYSQPEVFVTHDDGVTQRLALETGRDIARAGGFVARMACGTRRGRQQIEITGTGTGGSTVLANFPVWCAVEPPQSLTVDPSRDDLPAASPEDAEQRLLSQVNRDRAAHGLSALVADDRVISVARKYADEMQRTKAVAHVSPISGSVTDRVRAGGIRTAVVLENVARAYGVNEAHLALMNSPGHRANIMSPIATHLGIGVTFGEEIAGRREMFIAQVFIRVPPKLDATPAVAALTKKLTQVRALNHTAPLTEIAQQIAEALAAGKTRDEARLAVKRPLDGLGKQYRRVGSVITATSNLEGIDGASLLADTQADDIGLGIAQGPHPELGDGAIWIVLLLGLKH